MIDIQNWNYVAPNTDVCINSKASLLNIKVSCELKGESRW